MYRESYLSVDLNLIKDNYLKLQKHVNKPVFAVIKDNAYAHGAVKVAKKLEEVSCPYFCVANIDEAMELRNNNINSPILILGYCDQYEVAEKNDITISLTSLSHAQDIKENNYHGKLHINIDTGMNRYGIKRIDDLQCSMELLSDQCCIEGVYTHLYDADEEYTHVEQQLKRFYHLVNSLKYDFKWIHTSNSAGSILKADNKSNASRIGLSLYGLTPMESSVELKPAMKLISELLQVKPVYKGETIGYGGEYQVNKDGYVGIVPIGYGDGFLRLNSGRYVSINNHPYQIVGRVCMDQFMVYLEEEIENFTKVEIFGENIKLTHMADQLGMLVYEVLVLLNNRLEKVYLNETIN